MILQLMPSIGKKSRYVKSIEQNKNRAKAGASDLIWFVKPFSHENLIHACHIG